MTTIRSMIPGSDGAVLLLDTSVLVELKSVVLSEDVLLVSAISYAELRFGIEHAPDPSERRVRELRLLELGDLGLEWLPFDMVAGNAYGRLAARVAAGRPAHARSKDTMIAAHAYALGAGLGTLTPRDFEGV